MSFFLPRNEPVSNLVGAHHGTWRVPRERVSESFGRLQLRAGSEDCAQIWYVLGMNRLRLEGHHNENVY